MGLVAGFVGATRQKDLFMTIRGRGYRNDGRGLNLLLLIYLVGLSIRCCGQTYSDFKYTLNGTVSAPLSWYRCFFDIG
jgi:hypothetical protein